MKRWYTKIGIKHFYFILNHNYLFMRILATLGTAQLLKSLTYWTITLIFPVPHWYLHGIFFFITETFKPNPASLREDIIEKNIRQISTDKLIVYLVSKRLQVTLCCPLIFKMPCSTPVNSLPHPRAPWCRLETTP